MKTVKCFVTIVLCSIFITSISAQNFVEAGVTKNIYCNGSVQLNATPMNAWATQEQPLSFTGLNSVFFTTNEIGYAVGSGGVIFMTVNGGNNWFQKPISMPNVLYSVFFVNPTNGFIAGNSGLILITTDAGNTWNSVKLSTTSGFKSIYFTSVSTGYIIGTGGQIFKTIDGGKNWLLLKSGTSVSLLSVFFTSPDIGYVTGTSGTLLRTNDAGETWFPITTGVSSNLNSIHFSSATNGFISGSGGTILKTTDGKSWSIYEPKSVYMQISNDSISTTSSRSLLNTTLNSIYFTSDSTGYITGVYGSSSIFLKTIDKGVTWFEQPNNSLFKMTSLHFPSKNVGYAVGGGGTITKITNGEIKPLEYAWTPSEGLSNPNISNPVASPSVTTVYTVNAYEKSNPAMSFKDTVRVNVGSLLVTMPKNRIIGAEGSVLLDSVKVNYTGLDKLKYKWTPSVGLNSDTIASPIATVKQQTTYTVSVSTANGCLATSQTTVSLVPLSVTASVDKTVVCSGNVQLLATTNYSGTSVLHYKWTPSTGLSSDTVANPIAFINSKITYTVSVSTNSGLTATGNVEVKIANLTANAGADKTIRCGEKMQLDAVTTNYNGTGLLRYKWTPSEGLNSDTIANPISSPNINTSYLVTVTTPTGCTATDYIYVAVNPLLINAIPNQTVSCGVPVQLGLLSTNYLGSEPLKYKWTPSTGLNSDTIANPIANASNITYTITATTVSGCTASDSVVIKVVLMDKPTINFVGVDENNKNIIAWTKPTNGIINSFNVYKETNVTNTYIKVGSVLFDNPSVFVDANSNPDVQSNKYRISIVDACGMETSWSNYHKNMHLTINKGVNNIWNLIWEAYEGYSVSTYNIYRGTTPENIQIIGSLSGSNTQFSDYTAPAGFVFYQIEAISSMPLGMSNPNRLDLKSSFKTPFSSRSNIATNKSDLNGLYNLKDISGAISVYPNPADKAIQILTAVGITSNFRLTIYNTLGAVVKTTDVISAQQSIDISGLANGNYMIVITSNDFIAKQKLLIHR